MHLRLTWEVIGVKQMHRSNVSLHLPTKTSKTLALYGATP